MLPYSVRLQVEVSGGQSETNRKGLLLVTFCSLQRCPGPHLFLSVVLCFCERLLGLRCLFGYFLRDVGRLMRHHLLLAPLHPRLLMSCGSFDHWSDGGLLLQSAVSQIIHQNINEGVSCVLMQRHSHARVWFTQQALTANLSLPYHYPPTK